MRFTVENRYFPLPTQRTLKVLHLFKKEKATDSQHLTCIHCNQRPYTAWRALWSSVD